LTIRELFREFVAAKQRREDQHDRDVTLAWRMAALERQKTLPKLETLLSKRGSKQTAAEQRGVLHVLSAQYGIPIRTRRLH
jgi:hypothetical protein